jgi:hypothetical protein
LQVDFINVHLGLGFPIPLVMLNQSDILSGRDIGCVIGNFGMFQCKNSSNNFSSSLQ